jgi:hypothetical protein
MPSSLWSAYLFCTKKAASSFTAKDDQINKQTNNKKFAVFVVAGRPNR